MNFNSIDTLQYSSKLRTKAIRLDTKELLVAKLSGTSQETDITDPTNCGGVGRIRHFRRWTAFGWPENSLPIDPANHKLGIDSGDVALAQVFQNAACNWRCWYCYVPFDLLKADEQKGLWLTADELVDRYRAHEHPPAIIDLSGGQPDLTPEWIPWTMDALEQGGLSEKTFLWSDDNLSTDFFWTKLSTSEIDRVVSYRNYAKVGCFKGFDSSSFSFNTRAAPALFDQQFSIFKRIVSLGIDVYGYATFTAPDNKAIDAKMTEFVDRLQAISPLLPLRVVPLCVSAFRPAQDEMRINAVHQKSMEIQQEAIKCWNLEIESRFSLHQRNLPIYEVAI